jgi:putative ABC transport system permease protein
MVNYFRMNFMRSRGSSAALWHVGWRYLVVHGWQSLLMVFGIAVGVAVVVAIDLANASASRAFELSAEVVAGRATHEITAGPEGVDEGVYADLRRSGLPVLATPVLLEYITSPQLGNQPVQLLGIDPFTEQPFRSYVSGEEAGVPVEDLVAFLTRPGALLLAQPTAERFGLSPGDAITIEMAGRQQDAFVAGLLDPVDSFSRRTLSGLVLADIATAQELTGRLGRLDRIDLILAEDAQLAAIEALLPPDHRLAPSAVRSGSVAEMTAAFQLNLTALSLLALMVGLFLIYNTMTFSVVSRRPLFGTLRCLGVTRREVFSMVMVEALLVGLTGSLFGLLLGILLGRQTVGMVTTTINDLYYTTTVQAVGVPPESLLKGLLLGLAASGAAAALPAWEAASVPPQAALARSTLEHKSRRLVVLSAAVGLALIAAGMGIFILPRSDLISGFGGTFAVLTGFALLAALALVGLMRLASPLLSVLFGFLGRMAPRSLVNALSRTSIATAALTVAVSVTIGVTLMIDSFRHTVNLWLEATLQGDVYLSAPAFTGTAPSAAVDPVVVSTAAEWPGVMGINVQRALQIESDRGTVQAFAITDDRIGYDRLFLSRFAEAEAIWPAMQEGAVVISEPLARRFDLLARGGSLQLFTPNGWRSFPVIGVYYDYASSQGNLLMSMDYYRRVWQDDQVTAISLKLSPGEDADQIAAGLSDALAGSQRLLVRPNQALRADVLEVFDRTFAITGALRILATLVAVIGILNALLLLQMEKQREIGILRALGLTGRQLWRLVILETGLMGLTAGILAVPTGYALSLILIYIINQRSFGWTLQQSVQPGVFVQALLIALGAALLAGIYPAYRLSKMTTADVIRNE